MNFSVNSKKKKKSKLIKQPKRNLKKKIIKCKQRFIDGVQTLTIPN